MHPTTSFHFESHLNSAKLIEVIAERGTMVNRDEIRILIVDPSDTYQRIVQAVFRKLGFTDVTRAANPIKAQVMLEHDKSINIVVCELMMPDPDHGLAFVMQIRQRFNNESLPILMMTNTAEREYVQRAIKAGINGYLIKPINPDHLEAHLWRLFDLPLRTAQKMGEFLIATRVITREQRDLALNFQKAYSIENANLSMIALYLGFISVEELKLVFTEQFDDETFLERGGSLGMTEKQVEVLQKMKQDYQMRLGDILVKFGFVEKNALENALEQFRLRCISLQSP